MTRMIFLLFLLGSTFGTPGLPFAFQIFFGLSVASSCVGLVPLMVLSEVVHALSVEALVYLLDMFNAILFNVIDSWVAWSSLHTRLIP